jgi:hypothetical protein
VIIMYGMTVWFGGGSTSVPLKPAGAVGRSRSLFQWRCSLSHDRMLMNEVINDHYSAHEIDHSQGGRRCVEHDSSASLPLELSIWTRLHEVVSLSSLQI